MRSNNVLNSLIAASVKFSFKLNIGCPKLYEPKKSIFQWAKNKNKIFMFLMMQEKQLLMLM